MKLHEKYSHSAAIKQIMVVEKMKIDQMVVTTGVKFEDLNSILRAKLKMDDFVLSKILRVYPYMKGRIE